MHVSLRQLQRSGTSNFASRISNKSMCVVKHMRPMPPNRYVTPNPMGGPTLNNKQIEQIIIYNNILYTFPN